MKHLVNFSGGLNSWATAKRVAAKYGTADLVLLFADTLIEDEDLYRFNVEASANIGVPITRIAEGRTPWQVFFDERYLGNSKADPCSKILKRRFLDAWHEANCDPDDTTIYLGIDWSEEHRLGPIQARLDPWVVEAPLCSPPYLTKTDMANWCRAEGFAPPRLYELGFAHNNCGGFCIKAGQGAFANLLRVFPGRYSYHERKEQEIRAFLGKDISIMKDRRDGETKTLTMTQLRHRIEANEQIDLFDIGGCGCALDVEEET